MRTRLGTIMREFRAKAIINAPASEVFRIITDAGSYPKFDPNCERIDGRIELGRSIVLVSKAKPRQTTRMRIKHVTLNEGMIWEFGLPLNLLKRIRTFKVVAKDDQTTEFQMVEIQGGHLFNFLGKALPDQKLAFEQFAKGLKHFIESRP